MRILDRLIVSSFLRLFLLFVIGAPLLFILADITENLDTYLDRDLATVEIAWAYLHQIPQFAVWSFPIAALLATVFTIHAMTMHREIVAAKAGGISFHRVVAPLFLLGFLLTGAALAISEAAPGFNRTAADILEGESALSMWRDDFVFQTEDGYALSIRRLDVRDQTMRGISVEWLPPDQRGGTQEPASADSDAPHLHMVAEQAAYDPERGWVFHEGYYRSLGRASANGVVAGEPTDKALGFDSLQVRGLDLHPEELLEEPRHEDEMTYAELGRLAEAVERSGGDAGRLLTRQAQKLSLPVATLVIILFGAPLATTSKRGGAAFGVGISLGTTILYLLLFRLAGALGQSGALPPLLAAWSPNLLFLVAGLILLTRVRT